MRRADAFALGRLDAHDQAALVRRGEVSAAELVSAAITRIEALDPELNSVSHRAFDQATVRAGAATGEMAGVPYLLKEGLDYPGMPTRFGSRLYADATPAQSCHAYARRLDETGLVALGKSSAPEFALLPSTEPLLYGPTLNPWNPGLSTGGSSGGAAAAVAAGLVPLAHAADGGGSIRIPAACCGIVGLKPSRHGNLRARGPHVVEDLIVGDSLLGRSVRDVDWATRAAAVSAPSPDVRSRPLRVAVAMDSLLGRAPHAEVAEAIRRAADLCADLGHVVETVSLPIAVPGLLQAFKVIWGYLAADVVQQARSHLAAGVRETDVLEPWTLGLGDWGLRLTSYDLEGALMEIGAADAAMRIFFERHDVVLSPVVSTPPPALDALAPTRPFQDLFDTMFDYVSYTPLHNLLGLPACSLPLHWTGSGAPVGCMFAGPRGAERRLLDLAYALEEAQPWSQNWPPCSVGAVPSETLHSASESPL